MNKPRKINNVIITGATGVVGNALVRYLLDRGISVTAVVRPNSRRKKFLPQHANRLRVVDCLLGSYAEISDVLLEDSYDAFFHFAWEGSQGKERVANRDNYMLQIKNTEAALEAVELCRHIGCKTFIMPGSQAEYGIYKSAVTEATHKNPCNAYGIAKLCVEQMTKLLCAEYGIEYIWPILFSIYGPYDATRNLVDTTIRGLKRGDRLQFTAGEQMWDYMYSADAARALFLLAERGKNGESYNVSDGNVRPLSEYISEMYEVAKVSERPHFGEIPYRPNQQMFLGADIAKLKQDTGFEPEYTFKKGIAEIFNTLVGEIA